MHIVLGSYRSFKRYMLREHGGVQTHPDHWWINDPYKLNGIGRDQVKDVLVLESADPQLILAAEDRFGGDRIFYVE